MSASLKSSSGSALLVALALATGLAVVAIGLTASTTSARTQASMAWTVERARADARATALAAIVALDRANVSSEAVSTPQNAEIQDVTGLVDLTYGSETDVAEALARGGVSAPDAVRAARQIAQERTAAPNPTHTDVSAYAPPLRARCVERFLTTDSFMPVVDRQRAPSAAGRPPPLPDAQIGRMYRVRAYAPLTADAVITQELWVRLTGSMTSPVLIHRADEWVTSSATPFDPPECTGAANGG